MASTQLIEQNRELAERFVDGVWNGQDHDAYETLLTPDVVVHQIGKGEDVDREAFEAFVTEFRDAVPDLTFEIDRAICEDDEVVVHLTVSGTPEKPLGAIRPTGESFAIDAFQRYRIEDGRIAEAWLLPNAIGMMVQLGTMPDSPGKVLKLVAGQLASKIR